VTVAEHRLALLLERLDNLLAQFAAKYELDDPGPKSAAKPLIVVAGQGRGSEKPAQ